MSEDAAAAAAVSAGASEAASEAAAAEVAAAEEPPPQPARLRDISAARVNDKTFFISFLSSFVKSDVVALLQF
jgi:hypothetical protein